MQVILEDILIAARTLFGEARGESYESKKAIAHVLINRVVYKHKDRDHTLAAAALRHMQFSAWNEEDLNRTQMQSVTVNTKVYRDCIRAVLEALDEYDFTKGSRHYHTRAVLPRWAVGKNPTLTFGSHHFYNNVD